ncbi:MAG: hypothetical protein HGA47_15015 [Zoogloea sp.]|nr:hypothetical protein [Zoogloea sp.]
MKRLNELLEDYSAHFGARWSLPEYRQIELYTKKKRLAFGAGGEAQPALRGALSSGVAFMLLEAHFESNDPQQHGRPSWERYLALPKKSTCDKLVAELYRILRVLRIALVERNAQIAIEDGLIRTSCTFKRCAQSLTLTEAGLALLESAVFHYLDSPRQPYSEAYLEAMLLQYYADIVAEIKRFADEDRVLYQYRQPFAFNRHFRFDCDNPRFHLGDDELVIEIGAMYRDAARYPIDFYIVLDDALHIIPVEVLVDGCLPLAELPKWAARVEGGIELPPHFRMRFGRETMVVGLPMT